MAGSRPRQQHPSPSHPTVAKIAPMVPEVSLFFGGGRPAQERPLQVDQNYPQLGQGFYRPITSYNQDIINSSIGSPLPPPPQPSNRQPNNLLRRPSDFSRNFDSLSSFESFHSSNGNIHTQNYHATNDESNNNRGKVKFVDYVQPISSTSPFAQSHRNLEASSISNLDRQADNKNDCNYDRGFRESRLKSDESPVPPEILKVLNWQNDQLKMLQEQVSALLQASPQHNNQANVSSQDNLPSVQNYPVLQNNKVQDDVCTQVNQIHYGEKYPDVGQENWSQPSKDINRDSHKSNSIASNTEATGQQQYSVSSSSQRSVATNTSMLWPEIQQGLRKLTDALNEEEGEDDSYPNATEIRKSKISVNNSDNESAQSALNIDLPDYPASDCSPDLKKQASVQSGNNFTSPKQAGNSMGSPVQVGHSATSWESPVLGESVSMYEAEQIQEVYTDILSKVNRLLAEPEPTRDETKPRWEEQEPSRDEPDYLTRNRKTFTEEYSAYKEDAFQNGESSMAIATCNRLRQLGVSFISPEDLSPSRQSQQPSAALNEVSALFLPRAALPSESVWHPDQSPNTSLEISSLALKYLDEAQLSKLAVAHSSGSKSKAKSQQNSKVNQNSDVNMSLASQEFLNRYGLSNNSGNAGMTDTSPTLKSGRRPLTPIQNNPLGGGVGGGVGNKQILELRRDVLKGKYAIREANSGGGANYYATGENYCVQNYEMRYDADARRNQAPQVNHGSSSQQQQVRFHNMNRIPPQTQEPEVKNRILDITAIKSQPKFL